jgi:SAM-dependent methyltransferase
MPGKPSHSVDPTAFDAVAHDYDAGFTNSRLGRMLRSRVWQELAEHFHPGQHILELACGTGSDALWMAQQGMRVTASDGSAEMVQVAQAKVDQAGMADRVQVEQIALQEVGPSHFSSSSHFEGVLSDFGGLNTINDWRSLAARLAPLLLADSRAVLVVMGPFCPWEIGWHLLHGEWATAVRRLRGGATADLGQMTIPVWYPSARRLRHDFRPWFHHIKTESLGLWLPPSHLGLLVDRWPTIFARLAQIEEATARLTAGWGDHYLLVLERTAHPQSET